MTYLRRKTALQSARIYRDKCAELEQRCRDLESEKEAVRYFWRSQVLEGKTRAVKILMQSLSKNH